MYSCKYTIGDMRNEKYFYDYYNEFEYNHNLVVVIAFVVVIIIRMNFSQFQFLKRQI